MVFSVLLFSAVLAAAVVCVRQPRWGVFVLAAAIPFYTLLREASAGSPVFFVWPYGLLAILLAALAATELLERLRARGVAHPRRLLTAWGAGTAAVLLAVLEWDTRFVETVLLNTSLSSMGDVVTSTSFQAAALVGLAAMVLAGGLFTSALRRRPSGLTAVDVVVLAFLAFGILQIFFTYARNGILFTGLNGFRYYFGCALFYLPARYFLTSPGDVRRFVLVFAVATVVVGAQLLLESYLLNSVGMAPADLPWVGHLAGQFQYEPSPKAFFTGAYVPLGPLHFTHVSGLVVIVGVNLMMALALPASRARWLVTGLLAAGFLVAAGHWTSRTGLLILVLTTALLAWRAPVALWRRVVAVTVVALAIGVGSQRLIPGARYDLPAEITFLRTEAVPNLMGAIATDISAITGWRLGEVTDSTGWRPAGWRMWQDGGFERTHTNQPGRYYLDIWTRAESVDFRYMVPAFLTRPGDVIQFEVQFEALAPGEAGLQIIQGDRVTGIIKPHELGQIAAWTTELVVEGTAPVGLDVDVGRETHMRVRYAYLNTPRGRLRLLGWDPGQWLPAGWTLDSADARTWPAPPDPVVDPQGETLLFSSGAQSADFRFLVPPAMLVPGEPVVARMSVRGLAPTDVYLQLADRDVMVQDYRELRANEVRVLETTIPAWLGTAAPSLDIDLLPGGSVQILSVTVSAGAPSAREVAVVGRGSGALLAEGLIDVPLPTFVGAARRTGVVAGRASERTAAMLGDWAPPPLTHEERRAAAETQWTYRSVARRGFEVLFGRGAEFGTWNQVFLEVEDDQFAAESYSDTKYLEFLQQFGVIGMILLFALHVAPIRAGFRHVRGADSRTASLGLGLQLMVLISAVSLLHLPSLFLLGFGVPVFIGIALLASSEPLAE